MITVEVNKVNLNGDRGIYTRSGGEGAARRHSFLDRITVVDVDTASSEGGLICSAETDDLVSMPDPDVKINPGKIISSSSNNRKRQIDLVLDSNKQVIDCLQQLADIQSELLMLKRVKYQHLYITPDVDDMF